MLNIENRVVLPLLISLLSLTLLSACGKDEEEAKCYPDHTYPEFVVECTDHREQAGNAQRFHQEQAHGHLDQDNNDGRYFRDLEVADKITAADHLGHGAGDQCKVNHGTADCNTEYKSRNKKLADG